MKLKPETVAKTIKGWGILYPSQRRDQAQEAYIAKEFFVELKDYFSEEAFKLAAKKVKRHCKFFPTIADMHEVREEVVSEINRKTTKDQKALPEYTDQNTPEEKKKAAQRLAIIGQAISGKITYEEAEKQMQKLVGYAQN